MTTACADDATRDALQCVPCVLKNILLIGTTARDHELYNTIVNTYHLYNHVFQFQTHYVSQNSKPSILLIYRFITQQHR